MKDATRKALETLEMQEKIIYQSNDRMAKLAKSVAELESSIGDAFDERDDKIDRIEDTLKTNGEKVEKNIEEILSKIEETCALLETSDAKQLEVEENLKDLFKKTERIKDNLFMKVDAEAYDADLD